jgi:hypothetical protein
MIGYRVRYAGKPKKSQAGKLPGSCYLTTKDLPVVTDQGLEP